MGQQQQVRTVITMGASGFRLKDDLGNEYDLNAIDRSTLREVGRRLSKLRGFKARYVEPVPPIPLSEEPPARKPRRGQDAYRRKNPKAYSKFENTSGGVKASEGWGG